MATVQSVSNMLQEFGLHVPPAAVSSRNVAAVLVTASLPGFLRAGDKLDVKVARNLSREGGYTTNILRPYLYHLMPRFTKPADIVHPPLYVWLMTRIPSLRKAQIFWDLVAAENGVGFHNASQCENTLGQAIDLAHKSIATANRAAGTNF